MTCGTPPQASLSATTAAARDRLASCARPRRLCTCTCCCACVDISRISLLMHTTSTQAVALDVVGRPALAALTMAVEAAAAPVAAAAATARRAAGPRPPTKSRHHSVASAPADREMARRERSERSALRDDEPGGRKRMCRRSQYSRVPPPAIPDGPRTAYRFTPAWPYRYRLPGPLGRVEVACFEVVSLAQRELAV